MSKLNSVKICRNGFWTYMYCTCTSENLSYSTQLKLSSELYLKIPMIELWKVYKYWLHLFISDFSFAPASSAVCIYFIYIYYIFQGKHICCKIQNSRLNFCTFVTYFSFILANFSTILACCLAKKSSYFNGWFDGQSMRVHLFSVLTVS